MSLGSLLGMKPVSMRNWMPYMPVSHWQTHKCM